MQATVLVGLVSYVIWRDRRLKGTPLQTWPGWYAPPPCFDTRGICHSEQSWRQVLPQMPKEACRATETSGFVMIVLHFAYLANTLPPRCPGTCHLLPRSIHQ